MDPRTVVAKEPLTLFTTASLAGVYDRKGMLTDVVEGRLPRQRADRHIAKVLPAGSVLEVEDVGAADDVVHVIDCAYRPYFEKELFALRTVLDAAPGTVHASPLPVPPPDRVLAQLRALEGTRYLFGGSAPEGSGAQERAILALGLMAAADLDEPSLRRVARSAGIDCSGLFNVATGYAFFGDTKDVYARFQRGLVRLSGPDSSRPGPIAAALEPLDILIFRGHLMLALPEGRVIQAVGDGVNAASFARATGHAGRPFEKYDRVVIDAALPVVEALIEIQGRRLAAEWRLDDRHFMIVRWLRVVDGSSVPSRESHQGHQSQSSSSTS